jgi:hypothetical protein
VVNAAGVLAMTAQRPRVAFTAVDAVFAAAAGVGVCLYMIALSAIAAIGYAGLDPTRYAPWAPPLALVGATLALASLLLWALHFNEKEREAKKRAADAASEFVKETRHRPFTRHPGEGRGPGCRGTSG